MLAHMADSPPDFLLLASADWRVSSELTALQQLIHRLTLSLHELSVRVVLDSKIHLHARCTDAIGVP